MGTKSGDFAQHKRQQSWFPKDFEERGSGMSEHSVDSFSQKEINQFVPQSNNNGSGCSKWEEKPQK
ncbi:hypothetical protein [Flavobacterium algicola]|uniref:hypothetical protein n=1 Tax=Flavobacterium algicola TaxID=556529 RepID=UPI001EFED524|nr:hypothetical protein [Flavobacterium algicola]MCG9791985.1 hypothetical protein [Flavobacterium algicola]